MIVKFYELNKKKLSNSFFLLYGKNKGLIEETINNILKPKLPKNTYNYDEIEILKDTENFLDSITSKSFFDDEKLIIISRGSDKIFKIIEEIIQNKIGGISIIIKCNLLEKKSKLRNFFEKNKSTICIPFYEDDAQTLGQIAQNFFREKNINISRENINLIVERSNGDRINLNNELDKIEFFSKDKKNINLDQILKLTNLTENYSVSELVDNSLIKNKKKIITILNENNFTQDDGILILRIFLFKLKRLLKIQKEIKTVKNVDSAISSFKPPIFWKDKSIIREQIKTWSYDQIKKLIIKTNEIEYQAKKNPLISLYIITNFIMEQLKSSNNSPLSRQ
tara:strand:- start:2243 stop:3253 length:1011 start_codon:yes stop_codon:yes gene_type:complete